MPNFRGILDKIKRHTLDLGEDVTGAIGDRIEQIRGGLEDISDVPAVRQTLTGLDRLSDVSALVNPGLNQQHTREVIDRIRDKPSEVLNLLASPMQATAVVREPLLYYGGKAFGQNVDSDITGISPDGKPVTLQGGPFGNVADILKLKADQAGGWQGTLGKIGVGGVEQVTDPTNWLPGLGLATKGTAAARVLKTIGLGFSASAGSTLAREAVSTQTDNPLALLAADQAGMIAGLTAGHIGLQKLRPSLFAADTAEQVAKQVVKNPEQYYNAIADRIPDENAASAWRARGATVQRGLDAAALDGPEALQRAQESIRTGIAEDINRAFAAGQQKDSFLAPRLITSGVGAIGGAATAPADASPEDRLTRMGMGALAGFAVASARWNRLRPAEATAAVDRVATAAARDVAKKGPEYSLIVGPEAAKTLADTGLVQRGLPDTLAQNPHIAQIIDETPGMELTPDGGLRIYLTREQNRTQNNAPSPSTSMYYSVTGSKNREVYPTRDTRAAPIRGETVVYNPIFIGSDRNEALRNAFVGRNDIDSYMSKGGTSLDTKTARFPATTETNLALTREQYNTIVDLRDAGGSYLHNFSLLEDMLANNWGDTAAARRDLAKDEQRFLDILKASDIAARNPDAPAQMMSSFRDAYAIAHKLNEDVPLYRLAQGYLTEMLRQQGYDSVIAWDRGAYTVSGKPGFGEFIDLRQSHAPAPNGEFRLNSGIGGNLASQILDEPANSSIAGVPASNKVDYLSKNTEFWAIVDSKSQGMSRLLDTGNYEQPNLFTTKDDAINALDKMRREGTLPKGDIWGVRHDWQVGQRTFDHYQPDPVLNRDLSVIPEGVRKGTALGLPLDREAIGGDLIEVRPGAFYMPTFNKTGFTYHGERLIDNAAGGGGPVLHANPWQYAVILGAGFAGAQADPEHDRIRGFLVGAGVGAGLVGAKYALPRLLSKQVLDHAATQEARVVMPPVGIEERAAGQVKYLAGTEPLVHGTLPKDAVLYDSPEQAATAAKAQVNVLTGTPTVTAVDVTEAGSLRPAVQADGTAAWVADSIKGVKPLVDTGGIPLGATGKGGIALAGAGYGYLTPNADDDQQARIERAITYGIVIAGLGKTANHLARTRVVRETISPAFNFSAEARAAQGQYHGVLAEMQFQAARAAQEMTRLEGDALAGARYRPGVLADLQIYHAMVHGGNPVREAALNDWVAQPRLMNILEHPTWFTLTPEAQAAVDGVRQVLREQYLREVAAGVWDAEIRKWGAAAAERQATITAIDNWLNGVPAAGGRPAIRPFADRRASKIAVARRDFDKAAIGFSRQIALQTQARNDALARAMAVGIPGAAYADVAKAQARATAAGVLATRAIRDATNDVLMDESRKLERLIRLQGRSQTDVARAASRAATEGWATASDVQDVISKLDRAITLHAMLNPRTDRSTRLIMQAFQNAQRTLGKNVEHLTGRHLDSLNAAADSITNTLNRSLSDLADVQARAASGTWLPAGRAAEAARVASLAQRAVDLAGGAAFDVQRRANRGTMSEVRQLTRSMRQAEISYEFAAARGDIAARRMTRALDAELAEKMAARTKATNEMNRFVAMQNNPVENYLPHYYTHPDVPGTAPITTLGGSRAYQLERVFPTQYDAISAGFDPARDATGNWLDAAPTVATRILQGERTRAQYALVRSLMDQVTLYLSGTVGDAVPDFIYNNLPAADQARFHQRGNINGPVNDVSQVMRLIPDKRVMRAALDELQHVYTAYATTLPKDERNAIQARINKGDINLYLSDGWKGMLSSEFAEGRVGSNAALGMGTDAMNAIREVALGGDFFYGGHALAVGLADTAALFNPRHPAQSMSPIWSAIVATFRPSVMEQFRVSPDVQAVARDFRMNLSPRNLRERGIHTGFEEGQSALHQWNETLAGMTGLQRVALTPLRKVLQGWLALEDAQFDRLMPVLKYEMAQRAYDVAAAARPAAAADPLLSLQMKQNIGRHVEMAYGGGERWRWGLSSDRDAAERSTLLASKYMRGNVEAFALDPLRDIHLRNANDPNVAGLLARRFWMAATMGGMATSIAATALGLWVAGRLSLSDNTPGKVSLRDLVDPTRDNSLTNPDSSHYGKVVLPDGTAISPLGSFTTLQRRLAQIPWDTLGAAAEGYQKHGALAAAEAGLGEFATMLPATIAAYGGGKLGLAPKVAWDVITNEGGGYNKPVYDQNASLIARAVDVIRYAVQEHMPGVVQGLVLENANQGDSAVRNFNLPGINVSPNGLTADPYDAFQQAAQVAGSFTGIPASPKPGVPPQVQDATRTFLASVGLGSGFSPYQTYQRLKGSGALDKQKVLDFERTHPAIVTYTDSQKDRRAQEVIQTTPLQDDLVRLSNTYNLLENDRTAKLTTLSDQFLRPGSTMSGTDYIQQRGKIQQEYAAALHGAEAQAFPKSVNDPTAMDKIRAQAYGDKRPSDVQLNRDYDDYQNLEPAGTDSESMQKFFDLRRAYMKALPTDRRTKLQAYIQDVAARTPAEKQYYNALQLREQYEEMSPYIGVDIADAREVNAVISRVRARKRYNPSMSSRRALSLDEADPYIKSLARQVMQGRKVNRERRRFLTTTGAPMMRFFSDLVASETSYLAPELMDDTEE